MRKFVLYGVIVFQILLIISLVRGIQLSRRSSERIKSLQETKDKLVAEQQKLKKDQEYVQSPFYLEKVARDELHLAKTGETVVIIPDKMVVGGEDNEQGISDIDRDKPNWQKWWEVISGNE